MPGGGCGDGTTRHIREVLDELRDKHKLGQLVRTVLMDDVEDTRNTETIRHLIIVLKELIEVQLVNKVGNRVLRIVI